MLLYLYFSIILYVYIYFIGNNNQFIYFFHADFEGEVSSVAYISIYVLVSST